MACQLCENRELEPVFELGHHPPSDAFRTEEELARPQTVYPLTLVKCEACQLVQTLHTVADEELFSDRFVFRTGDNQALRSHFRDLVAELVSLVNLDPGDLVVDVGSNDGTLLKNYPDHVEVLGVEPSRPAEIAITDGVSTRREFFSRDVADDIVDRRGTAKIVTATNVLAHAGDLHSFMEGVDRLLADDGIFVQESQYLLDLVVNVQFDNVYLEHRRYYSMRSLCELFDRFGLQPWTAERVDTQGGSIKTLASRPGVYQPDGTVRDLLETEERHDLHDITKLRELERQAEANRLELLDLLSTIRNDGERVAGVGAAAKGVSRLNYCRIGPELVEYVADVNEYKIGKYTAGTHIQVVSDQRLLEDDPDYALLLAWNLADVIVPKLREGGFEGQFIVPSPTVRIVE